MEANARPGTFLITGGAGSLGTALTRRLLSGGHKIRVFSRDEHKHETLWALVPAGQRTRLTILMGDVRDRERLNLGMRGVDHVIHAAAVKVIPAAETNPIECARTNIEGTINVIGACVEAGVKRAAFISTDKACSPSTMYGASKLCAERLWSAANVYRGPDPKIFVTCRYGNVWGSRGSVIHAFQAQVLERGTITITDRRCTRFHWMLDDAVEFVLATLAGANPGEIWVPRLSAYNLGNMADAFRDVAGLNIEPEVSGLRPAEKLHEEMISETESSSVVDEDGTRFVLKPGSRDGKGGWNYASGKKPWIGREKLKELVRCTLSSLPRRAAPTMASSTIATG